MNYIQHLNSFYNRIYTDDRITPHHISLYGAIFQLWNTARFEEKIFVNRQEMMTMAKIGSANTYVRCQKELDAWQYIQYFPSRNMSIGSRIRVIIFDNTTDNTAVTALRPFNKQYKTILNIPTIKEVEEFFIDEKFPIEQGALFFNHYRAKGWMMGETKIKNWQAAAIGWMSKQSKFENRSAAKNKPSRVNNLSATTNKSYNEPL